MTTLAVVIETNWPLANFVSTSLRNISPQHLSGTITSVKEAAKILKIGTAASLPLARGQALAGVF